MFSRNKSFLNFFPAIFISEHVDALWFDIYHIWRLLRGFAKMSKVKFRKSKLINLMHSFFEMLTECIKMLKASRFCHQNIFPTPLIENSSNIFLFPKLSTSYVLILQHAWDFFPTKYPRSIFHVEVLYIFSFYKFTQWFITWKYFFFFSPWGAFS